MAHPLPPWTPRPRHFHVRPTAPLAIKAVRLVASVPLVTWSFGALLAATGDHVSLAIAPYFVLTGVLAILVGGGMGLLAIRRGERSVAAMATVPFFGLALIVFVGELIQLLVWLL